MESDISHSISNDFLKDDEIARIREIPHFRQSREAELNIGLHYRSYVTAFAALPSRYGLNPEPTVIADIGTGYGWLAIALARRSNAHIIAVEMDESRMAAARSIAAVLGVEQSIDWRVGCLPNLPLADHEADVTFCVEVIEHVSNRPQVVGELGRVTRDMLVISSPNRNCPVINHDTGLPFCHWLPPPLRDRYAALFGRTHLQDNNKFWSPGMVAAALPDFSRQSRFLQFRSYRDFVISEQQLRPQAGNPRRTARTLLLGACALLGNGAVQLLPNLASTFRRKKNTQRL
jgi:SAM-dependent methyltransferase